MIASIRQYLTLQAASTLVCAFVLSRLDYCNSLYAGAPQVLLDKLQKVQNSAARLVCKARKSEHVTPLFKSLHWLPISARIQYKVCTLCYKSLHNEGPQYLSDLLTPYKPRRRLRSSADSLTLEPPRKTKKSFGDRCFSFTAPLYWNRLPSSIREAESISSFKSRLKTFLFEI